MTKGRSKENENALRGELVSLMRQLEAKGLNRGSTGNASARLPGEAEACLITPSGISPADMTPESIVKMHLSGEVEGDIPPSSEWRLHRDILQNMPDTGAVIHAHAMFATTLACMKRDIPPFHYMIALAGGDSIRCAPYALFGSQELSDVTVAALKERLACLMAHHGMVATGRDLKHAAAIAIEVEALCEQYWRLLQTGEPEHLSASQMEDVIRQFASYGQWKKT